MLANFVSTPFIKNKCIIRRPVKCRGIYCMSKKSFPFLKANSYMKMDTQIIILLCPNDTYSLNNNRERERERKRDM